VCKGKGRIISGARRWKRRKYQPNENADNGSALDRGGRASEYECDTTRYEANDDSGERTCPGLIDSDACCQPDEICGELRYVAQGRYGFLWSALAGCLRHIFLYG